MTSATTVRAPRAWQQPGALCAALGFAIFAVWVDLHNDEPQAAALILATGGFIAGALWPRRAWRWALILGLSILVGDPLGVRLGITPPWPEQGLNFGALVALVPAAIGTYIGAGLRQLMSGASSTR